VHEAEDALKVTGYKMNKAVNKEWDDVRLPPGEPTVRNPLAMRAPKRPRVLRPAYEEWPIDE
jgi:hypothetical protein